MSEIIEQTEIEKRRLYHQSATKAVIDSARAYALLKVNGVMVNNNGAVIHVSQSSRNEAISAAKADLLLKAEELLLEDALFGQYFSNAEK